MKRTRPKQGGNVPVHPVALELSFGNRTRQHLEYQLYKRLGHNLEAYGITDYLDDLGSPDNRWETFTGLMDTIVQVEDIKVYGGTPPHRASLDVTCKDREGKERLHDFLELIWNGIPGPNNPKIRPKANEQTKLEMTNISYPEVCTAGRIGTLLFRQQFGRLLGRNERLASTATIGVLDKVGFMPYLSTSGLIVVRNHIENFKSKLPYEQAKKVFVSGGGTSIIGMALRSKLHSSQWFVQRPKGEFPLIERGLPFHSRYMMLPVGEEDDESPPLSGTSIGKTLKGQWSEFKGELINRDNWLATIIRLGAFAIEVGLTEESLLAFLKAGGTAVGTPGAALLSKRTDSRTLKQLGHMRLLPPPREPEV